MREVLIKTFYKEQSEYVARLGNGTIHKFKSEKATKKFLADTNRFLTEFTYRCNTILQIRLLNYGEAECFGKFSTVHMEQMGDVISSTKLRVA